MNLHYLATILFLASSASEAKNLRFEKPKRLLGNTQIHHQNEREVETGGKKQIRFLKNWKNHDHDTSTFNVICVIPRDCSDITEHELRNIAKKALKKFNSDDWSCDPANCPQNRPNCCDISSSSSVENFGTVLHESCDPKKMEKELEKDLSSADSGSKSRRIRMLRHLNSHDDEADLNMACIQEEQVNTRSGCSEEVDLGDIADEIADQLKSNGSAMSFDSRSRRLSGSTDVMIVDLDDTSQGRSWCTRDSDNDESDLVEAYIAAIEDNL